MARPKPSSTSALPDPSDELMKVSAQLNVLAEATRQIALKLLSETEDDERADAAEG